MVNIKSVHNTLVVVLNMTVLDWQHLKNIVTSVVIDNWIWIILIGNNFFLMAISRSVRNHIIYLVK